MSLARDLRDELAADLEGARAAGPKDIVQGIVDTVLGLALFCRIVIHTMSYAYHTGEQPSEVSYSWGAHFAVEDHGLSAREELQCRNYCTAAACLLPALWQGINLASGPAVVAALLVINWLAVLLDPALMLARWVR